jgi:hypothetical protein
MPTKFLNRFLKRKGGVPEAGKVSNSELKGESVLEVAENSSSRPLSGGTVGIALEPSQTMIGKSIIELAR